MTARYNPSEIEPKWQQFWDDKNTYHATDESDKPKYYTTMMFPYPSGAGMHVGHFLGVTIVDVMARFHRAQGFNVMYPMGWDAFGLPAENYAIKTGTAPVVSTKQNIANFTNQLKRSGASIDWQREIDTSDPEYYRWTQWVFTEFFKRGLAYQKEANQWWCDIDQTVLANEQVVNGKCWRHDGPDDPLVAKRKIKQWFFKITDYADSLLEEIPSLDWPEKIKTAQENWIGKSVGTEIDFVANLKSNYVLLHGYTGLPTTNFFPWIKAKLQDQDADAVVPALPNTEEPDAKEQAAHVLSTVEFNEDTVLLGHSYGSVTALRIVEQLKQPIKKLVLVAGFAEPGFLDRERNFEKTTDWQFDFEKIRQNVKEIIILRASNDTAVPAERADYLQQKLGGMIVDFEATEDHVCGEVEPAVLSSLINTVAVFTTRPDTIFGATFLVLAPEHALVPSLTIDDTRLAVEQYVSDALKKSDIERMSEGKDKTGVFSGSYATNPATGEKIPIWIADYVLGGYGTGAIMAVPAHDERDLEFAEKFELPIVAVIDGTKTKDGVIVSEGALQNSGAFDGIESSEAREEIVAWLEQQKLGRSRVTYKMRDWLISRQRYWGAPIPIIHCDKHGAVPVPEKDLPVLLPEVEDYAPKGEGSVLATVEDWVNTTCPTCGSPAKRETDTMDGYACSSWYLLRYADPQNSAAAWGKDKAKYWAPIDLYVGGDHAVAHLLYVRFWSHVFYDVGLVPTKEPVKKLAYHGYINAEDGTKMSKSKGNVVDPLEVIDAGYGADALRVFELFLGPIEENSSWSSEGIAGIYRFLNRTWTLVDEYLDAEKLDASSPELVRLQHKTIKKVTTDIYRHDFNTAIAAMMEYVNDMYKLKTGGFSSAWQSPLESLVQLLQPFAPHMTAELWQRLGHDSQLDFADWPVWDDKLMVADTITIVVQVNGKVRAKLSVAADASDDDIKAQALANEAVVRHLGDKKPTKVIYVPGRLMSIVV